MNEFIITRGVRIEKPELPEEALREALLNAIAHRDYRSTANIQLYLFKDRLELVSPGGLPPGLLPEELGKRSTPRNVLLFGMLFRMGLIEQIGSGLRRIRKLCQEANLPEPVIQADEHWFTVIFWRQLKQDTDPVSDPDLFDLSTASLSPNTQRLMRVLQTGEMGSSELMQELGIKHRTFFRQHYLKPALEHNVIELTLPEKPNSRLQKYRLKTKKEPSA